MKDVINAIADSLESEVGTPGGWAVQRFDPVWRDPSEGKTIYVFGTRQVPGEFRTTGTREDIYEVIVEAVEPSSAEMLTRDEDAELDFAEFAQSLTQWADDHENLPPTIHRLDYTALSYAPDVRREAAVRYCQMTLHARKNATYA